MSAERTINKVVITEEAEFDYESLLGQPLPRGDIKTETETYIDNTPPRYGCYFRAKYYDETADKMLLLFFYKGKRFGPMQMWELKGICFAEDWSEELEDSGQIRVWLNSSLDPKDEGDWVEELRLWQGKEQREREDYNDAE